VQSSSVTGSTLTILLKPGTLKAGDDVAVTWSGLQSQDGQMLTGNSETLNVK
jgi:hypothetical protein